MRDRARQVDAQLDDVSAHLGEVLRRADQLLAEWSRFGDAVRAQVDREAGAIGDAVASSIDGAVMRGTAASVDRALAERTNALATELGRLEVRCRAIARERQRHRLALWAVIAGVLAANALLVWLLVRPAEPIIVHEQTPVVVPVPTAVPVPPAPPADVPRASGLGPPETGSNSEPAKPTQTPKHPVTPKTQGAPVKRG